MDFVRAIHTPPGPGITNHSETCRTSLRVIIVGAGIGGLSAAFCLGKAGHNVIVFESASKLREIGAGIQLSPNVTRLLIRWGLEERLREVGVRPEYLHFCRYDTGERIGFTVWGDKMDREFDAPYLHIYRADLLDMLYDITKPLMDLHLGKKVVSVDTSEPSVILEDGDVVTGDIIIGADGLHSVVHSFVQGGPVDPVPMGDCAYRATIAVAELLKDPDLRPLVETPQVHCWLGPGRHIIGYCIKSKQEYNVVMVYPEEGGEESWTAQGRVDDMRACFQGWEPRVLKLQSLMSTVLRSKLMHRPPMESWMQGRVVLLGDACHPMPPYRAQGAAMAIEDAAVIGNLLSRLTCVSQIEPLLRAYQELRLPRATKTSEESWSNRRIFHMPDGETQRSRDASMRAAMKVALDSLGDGPDGGSGNANMWADKAKNMEQFAYDADEASAKWWNEHGHAISPPAEDKSELVESV